MVNPCGNQRKSSALELEGILTLKSAKFLKIHLEMEWVDL